MKKPINTKIKCPKCGEIIDFAPIKDAIKQRIIEKYDLELDSILEEI